MQNVVFTSCLQGCTEKEEVLTLSLDDGEDPPYDVEAGEERSISLLLQQLSLCFALNSIGSIVPILDPSLFVFELCH